MAVETEMYLVFPEEFYESHNIAPAVLISNPDEIRDTLEQLQAVSTEGQIVLRVLRITEAESMYKITPEALAEDEEVDEDLMTQIKTYLESRTNI